MKLFDCHQYISESGGNPKSKENQRKNGRGIKLTINIHAYKKTNEYCKCQGNPDTAEIS